MKIEPEMKFERLTVVSDAGVRSGSRYWNCRCECGAEKTVCGSHLISGATRSCGCLLRDVLRGRKKVRIRKTYPRLTIGEGSKTEIFWVALHPETDSYKTHFWSKVEVSAPDTCWQWMGRISDIGYGTFNMLKCFGRQVQAHRVAFLMEKGFLPLGRLVHIRHLCNNRLCCNPRHLAIGTAKDNSADRMRSGIRIMGDAHYARREPGRLARGDRHGCAILTEAQVREARRLYMDDTTQTGVSLAKQFGVKSFAMYAALTGKTWSHVPGAITTMRPGGIRRGTRMAARCDS